MPPEELFDNRTDVREGVPVRERREPIRPDDPIELRPRSLLNFRVEGERREEALERGVLLSSQFSGGLGGLTVIMELY